MRFGIGISAVVCTLLTETIALQAQNAPPAPPATRTTRPFEYDQQNLQAALRQLCAGVFAEDGDVIRAGLHADRALVDAQTRRVLASIRLAKALDLMRPNDIAIYEHHRIIIPSDFAMILGATNWEIKGDRATAEDSFGFKLPEMINVKGVWKLNIVPSPPVASQDALAAAIAQQAHVIEQVADDIAAGKLKTSDDVTKALGRAPTFAPSACRPDIILSK